MGKNKKFRNRHQNADSQTIHRRKSFMTETLQERVVKIKVIGIGGAGNNVINRMIEADSLYSGETECSKGHCQRAGCPHPAQRIYGGQRIPSDVDLRSPLYPQGAPRLYPPVEELVAGEPPHDTSPLRHQAHR